MSSFLHLKNEIEIFKSAYLENSLPHIVMIKYFLCMISKGRGKIYHASQTVKSDFLNDMHVGICNTLKNLDQ